MPLSMCRWKVSADDVLQRHGTPSQTGPASTPEAIWDQQSSGGPLEKYQCMGHLAPRLVDLLGPAECCSEQLHKLGGS